MRIAGIIYFIFYLVMQFTVTAQSFLIVENDTIFINSTSLDSAALVKVKNDWLLKQINEGYLYASVDSVVYKNGKVYLGVYKGPKFEWSGINLIREKDTMLIKKPQLSKVDKYLKSLTNEGYPFASIRIQNLELEQDQASSFWEVVSGPFIQFDSVFLIQPIPVKKSYLQKLLEIPIGSPYSEKKFRSIEDKINSIPFLTIKNPPDIAFEKGKAIVYLNLSYLNTSAFDGVIGFLPNQSRNGGTLLTGYLNLSLKNLFRSGKNFSINWQRFAEESQQTELAYFHPFIFNSSVGINGSFSLVKQDTSFLNRMIGLGISAAIFNNAQLSFKYEFNGSQVQGDQNESNQRLGSFATNWYEIQVVRENYLLNRPQNGMAYDLSLALGQRNLENQVTDSIPSRSSSFRIHASLQYQQLVKRSIAIYTSTNVGLLRNQNLFQNELFRLGGFNSFRGYNENEFFLSEYAYQKTEFRYYFNSQSVIFGLYDTGYLSNRVNKSLNDWYYAFGIGLALKNDNGLFSIIFATGNTYGNPVSVNNTNVHFGYTALF